METTDFAILFFSAAVLAVVVYLMYREAGRESYGKQCARDKKGWHGKK
ncbi:MAG: hypothetical protein WC506_01640 [Candidatus Micrarchaeia archaeon]